MLFSFVYFSLHKICFCFFIVLDPAPETRPYSAGLVRPSDHSGVGSWLIAVYYGRGVFFSGAFHHTDQGPSTNDVSQGVEGGGGKKLTP